MLIQKTFKNDWPTLYVVGTPIGNLADFSFRGIEILKKVDYILCEDTRTSQVLLNHYQINKPLISLHKYNELERSALIADYLTKGQNLALISDAGLPTISDPGGWLLHNLRFDKQVLFNISAINCGPAYLHALCASALQGKTNYFHGFLTSKSPASKRQELVSLLSYEPETLVCFYESVHRIQATTQLLTEILPDSTIVVIARELTKLNEEFISGSINEVNTYLQSSEFVAKGEFVVCFTTPITKSSLTEEEQVALVEAELAKGVKLKMATKAVSQAININSNQLYELFLKKHGKKP